MVALSALALALSAASLAAAQSFQITSPSADRWWVAKSNNVFAWDCKNNPHPTFGVYLANVDQNVFAGDLAFIPQEQNADCSKIVTQDQVNQPPHTGYIIKLTDPVNVTNVYAQSEPFEIKPAGSAFPSTSVAGNPSSTSGSSAAGSTSTDKPNGAVSLKTFGFGFTATVVGTLAYLM